jgi:Rrf2 family protein
MIELALNYERGEAMGLGQVSEREGISEKYLGQIVIPLKAAGLIVSVRGSEGGYLLARPPRDITVLDVAEVLEGGLEPVPCVPSADCDRSGECAARELWCELDNAIRQLLKSYTLERLADIYKRTSRIATDYVI